MPRVEAPFFKKVNSKVAHNINASIYNAENVTGNISQGACHRDNVTENVNRYSAIINVGTVIRLYLLHYVFSHLSMR